MIQRIQTLYLFLAAIAMSATLLFPLATIVVAGNEVELNAFGVAGLGGEVSALWLFICLTFMLVLPTLLPLVIIFLYKKRLLQIRLCVSEIVLQLGALACIAIYCWRLSEGISAMPCYQGVEAIFKLGWPSIMPVIAIVLTALAIRGITKDEALVRSLDRIR